MRMRMARATLLVALLSAAGTALAQRDVHVIAKAVDRHYNRLHTLEAQFTENYQGAGIVRQESGTLWLKKPGKMRWQYRQPREKLFVSDGKNAWFYVPGEQQARKQPAKNLEDLRSPLAFLLGRTKLEKEFDGLSFAPDVTPLSPGNIVLRGVPKFLQGVSQVLFEVSPEGRIDRIVVDREDGSTTEYRFLEQREDMVVADGEFRFSPPPGIEVIAGEVVE